MRVLALVLVAFLLLSAAGCSRPSPSGAGEGPTPEGAGSAVSPAGTSAPPQFSFIHTGDVRARTQLLSGWYAIEEGAWRWMAKEAEAVLLTPHESPVSFELRLVFPEGYMKRAGGPVTVSVLLERILFVQETYNQPGAYTLHKPVPAGTLPQPSTRVTIRLDRSMPPGGADKRELGAVVQSLGFVK